MIQSYVPDLLPSLPEIILAIGALVSLVIGVFSKNHSLRITFGIAKLTILIAFSALVINGFHKPIFSFSGQYVADYFSDLLRLLILISAELILWVSSRSCNSDQLESFEFPILLVLSTLGALICVAANDLLILFIGVELMTLPTLVMMAMRKKDPSSAEASIKYFALAAIGSALLLFGASYIYGFVGNTNYDVIFSSFENAFAKEHSFIPIIGIYCILIALCFKAAAAPLHMWAADVYEGAPLTVTLFFASIPKLAVVAAIIRLTSVPFLELSYYWAPLITVFALISLVVGAYAALQQTNLRRLIAYASTANMGYILIGISLGTQIGSRAALYYMSFYLFSTILLFTALLQTSKRGYAVNNLSDLNGLAKVYPFTAFVLTFTFFSMAGLPPFPGFIAKLSILHAALHHHYLIVPILAILTAVVSVAYYLKIMKNMFFSEPTIVGESNQMINPEMSQKLVVFLLLMLLMFFMLMPGYFIAATTKATSALFFLL